MEWNVFYHDSNKQELKTFNIFDHSTFNENVQKLLKKYKDKNEFAENLKRELMYYFWCKSEYEVIISPWCGGRNTKDIKVDIYTQVMNNWDIFLNYVWESKQHRSKHGYWFLLDECANEGVYCSNCYKKVYKVDYANQKLKSKFCPNCGAIMDREYREL